MGKPAKWRPVAAPRPPSAAELERKEQQEGGRSRPQPPEPSSGRRQTLKRLIWLADSSREDRCNLRPRFAVLVPGNALPAVFNPLLKKLTSALDRCGILVRCQRGQLSAGSA